ncbi:MAG: hypothetical protein HY908_26245 [Myxococcales bacterium]|nr:hypothetical protein [Myxococcales bacterium]
MESYERIAIHGLPIVAGLATALSILGPGRAAPVSAARVYGRLGPDAPVAALRVVTLRDTGDGLEPEPCAELVVELRADGRPVDTWRGTSDDAGVAESRLARPAAPADPVVPTSPADAPPATVRVRCGDAQLAEGPLVPRALVWTPAAGWLDGEREGPVRLGVRLPRAVLAPPFPEELLVVALCPECGPDLALRALGEGLSLEDPQATDPASTRAAATAGATHAWHLRASALAPAVALELEARDAAGHGGSWRGELPVTNGAMWLDPDTSAGLVVRAPGPQRRVFVSLLGRDGRLAGLALPLAPDATRFGTARTAPDALPEGALLAVLASDPAESGSGAVAWPLGPATPTLTDPGLDLACDGLPEAQAHEAARRRATRLPFVAVILAAGLAEMLLAVRFARRPPRTPAAEGEELPTTGSRGAAVLAFVGLAVAFAALAAVAMWVAF